MTIETSKTASAAMQSQLDGLRAGVKPTAIIRGIDTHTFSSGRTLGVPKQPHDDPRSEASVLMSIGALRDLDAVGQEVTGNRHLSDAGKADEMSRRAVPHIQRIAQQWADLDAQEADAQDREDKHYTPQPRAMGDAAGVAVDSEIRSRFAAMTPDAQGKVLSAVRAGNTPSVGDALMRDPFGTSEPATNAWRAGMDVRAPVPRAEIDMDRASVNWARPVVRRVAEMAKAASGMDKIQLARALAPSYAGAGLFGLSDGEVMVAKSMDARRAAQAASSNALATSAA